MAASGVRPQAGRRSPRRGCDTAQVAPIRADARLTWPIRTVRAELRPVARADSAAVLRYRRLEPVARHLSHPPLSDLAAAEALVDGWLRDDQRVSAVVLRDGTIVGDVHLGTRSAAALRPATTAEREGWVGYAFHPDAQGEGLATEAVGALVRAGFAQLRLRRVTARVFGPARSSSRLLARLGFQLDGVDRAAVLAPDGHAWWDDECWSALPGEVG